MGRLNLTLDDDTLRALNRHATRARRSTAAIARSLLRKAIEREEAIERARKLAHDYAAGREDQAALAAEMESPQLDLLDGD